MQENENPFFSIIIVSLNPGKKLTGTLESVEKQTFHDFEVIVKDGLSTDGSVEEAGRVARRWAFQACGVGRGCEPATPVPGISDAKGGNTDSAQSGAAEAENRVMRSLRVIRKKDGGIYDAMNQGVLKARGRYVYFLNCGDLLCSETVLKEMADFIEYSREKSRQKNAVEGTGRGGAGNGCGIFYGNIFERITGQRVVSNPHMDAFGCYRNVPCHQACFYARELLLAHPFDTGYRVRADYEQFLWCFFEGNRKGQVNFAYRDMLIADYEGGGFSETRKNRRISAREHREIARKYLSRGQLFRFRLIMLLSLSQLRTAISHNKRTAGVYNRLKERVYSLKR